MWVADVGSALVGRAYAFAAMQQLPPLAMGLLVWMAHHAKDDDAPPVYWARREKSAVGIGRLVPDLPRAEAPDFGRLSAERNRAFEAVAEQVAILRVCGAIKWREDTGRAGRTSEYELRFEPVDTWQALTPAAKKKQRAEARKRASQVGAEPPALRGNFPSSGGGFSPQAVGPDPHPYFQEISSDFQMTPTALLNRTTYVPDAAATASPVNSDLETENHRAA